MKKPGKSQLNIEMDTEDFVAMREHCTLRKESQAKFVRRSIRETIGRDLDAENPPMPELPE